MGQQVTQFIVSQPNLLSCFNCGPVKLSGSGDHYLHLPDLQSYSYAHARLGQLYMDKEAWSRKAVLNIAASGRLSSDRTIAEYAKEIWQAAPCTIEEEGKS